jgi:hypothetical protein
VDEVKSNLVVYTAIFGDYDELIEPKEKYDGCDFICFTDQKNLKSDIWQIKVIEKCDLPPNIMNRKYKMLPHLFFKEYKWSLYVDGNIAIIGNPLELVKKYSNKNNMLIPKHFSRNCIYEEAKECVILGKATYKEIKIQIEKYKKEGFPKNFGLGENNIILRKHNNKKVIKMMNDWWKEFNSYKVKRDQLSLAYVLWKNNEEFNYMDESSRNENKYFKYVYHKKERNINLKNKLINKIKISLKRIIY